MPSLFELLSEMLRGAGYRVVYPQETADGAPSMAALKDGRTTALEMWPEEHAPDDAFVASLLNQSVAFDADRRILINLGRPYHGSREHEIEQWDVETLVRILGRAALQETLPGLVGPTDPLAPRAPAAPPAGQEVPAVVEPPSPEPPPLPPPDTGIALPPPVAVPHEQPDFEELPGRAAEPLDEPETPVAAAPERPEMAPPLDDFEVLPGRATIQLDAEPPPAMEGRDFEVLDDESIDDVPSAPIVEDRATLAVPPAFSNGARQPPGVLRFQVAAALAHNMARDRVGTVQEQKLRLVPHHVYEYEADVLVDGSLDAQTTSGTVSVDAWMKRASPWRRALETAPIDAAGASVEQRPVKISDDEGKQLVLNHLADLVGRDVVQQEDSDEWSIVVRKRVQVDGAEVRVSALGTYWLPIWRLSGPNGSVEIDASSGQILEEDIRVQRTDAQLI